MEHLADSYSNQVIPCQVFKSLLFCTVLSSRMNIFILIVEQPIPFKLLQNMYYSTEIIFNSKPSGYIPCLTNKFILL